MTMRLKKEIQNVQRFLENYQPGQTLHVYLSTAEKKYLKEYLQTHPIGKNFNLKNGVFKPGYLEHDYYLEEKK